MTVERRRTSRACVSGNAIVHAVAGPTRCDLVNLSMGGAMLRRAAGGPALAIDDPVTVDLHLDGANTAWIAVSGLVHRIEPDGAFCVIFGEISAAFEDVVEDEVLADLESAQRPRAVVVDAVHERASRLAEGLRAAGCDVEIVASPLEAIWWIEQSRAHVSLALISEPASAGTLMEFLRETHPAVLRAAIGERPPGGTDDIDWVFTDQPDLGRQLRRLVARVVVPPWAASALGE